MMAMTGMNKTLVTSEKPPNGSILSIMMVCSFPPCIQALTALPLLEHFPPEHYFNINKDINFFYVQFSSLFTT